MDLGRDNPIAALQNRRRFISVPRRQPLFLPPIGPQHHRTQQICGETGDDWKFFFDLSSKRMDLLADMAIHSLELAFHDPECGIVCAAEFPDLTREALAHALIRVVLVALPALEDCVAHAKEAWSVDLEIPPERPVEERFRVVPRDGRMAEVELELAVDVRRVYAFEDAAFRRDLPVELRAGRGSVEHELMKIRVMVDGVFDLVRQVLRGVVF